tara:strand:+ start:892 stop:1680 length:789 start_codon:yes stop_codon:yes gene_type:complete
MALKTDAYIKQKTTLAGKIPKDTSIDSGFPTQETVEPSINPIKFQLKKRLYGVKEALFNLDEEFKHFILKKYNIKEFFTLYNKTFFDLNTDTHKLLMARSMQYAYPDGYENFRTIEKRNLSEELKDVQKQIDSVEREHFYFKNGSFIMNESFLESSTSVVDSGENVFYIQSGKKRKIINSQIYSSLKNRVRKTKGPIDDKDFISFVDTFTLNTLPSGPEINEINDIYISTFEINIYPRTPETYDPDFEEPDNPVNEYLNPRD